MSVFAQAFWLVLGSVIIGAAIAMVVRSNLGLPPNDVFASAIAKRTPLTLGQSGWTIAGVLFLTATLLGRRPTIWGLSYVLIIGSSVDAISELLNEPQTYFGRWGFLAASIAMMAFGVNLVLHSGTTGGPFELLMLAGEDRGVSRTLVRYVLDIGVLVTGIVLGGDFGIGTVVNAAAFGAVMAVISRALDDHRVGRRYRLQAAGNAGQSDGSGEPAIAEQAAVSDQESPSNGEIPAVGTEMASPAPAPRQNATVAG